GRGNAGVGMTAHWFAGNRFSRPSTPAASAGGVPTLYHAGSCGPVRAVKAPGFAPNFLAPSASGLLTSRRHDHAWFFASSTTTVSFSSAAADRKKFAGPTGADAGFSHRATSSQRPAETS